MGGMIAAVRLSQEWIVQIAAAEQAVHRNGFSLLGEVLKTLGTEGFFANVLVSSESVVYNLGLKVAQITQNLGVLPKSDIEDFEKYKALNLLHSIIKNTLQYVSINFEDWINRKEREQAGHSLGAGTYREMVKAMQGLVGMFGPLKASPKIDPETESHAIPYITGILVKIMLKYYHKNKRLMHGDEKLGLLITLEHTTAQCITHLDQEIAYEVIKLVYTALGEHCLKAKKYQQALTLFEAALQPQCQKEAVQSWLEEILKRADTEEFGNSDLDIVKKGTKILSALGLA